MKKFLLLSVLVCAAFTVNAQGHLSTVQGKTKDGKSLKVEYYHGNQEDYIETVKYQLVDELEARVNTLQNNIKDLQSKLDAANRKNSQLQTQLNNSSNSGDETQLRDEIAQLNNTVRSLNDSISALHAIIKEYESNHTQLTSQLAQTTARANQNEQIIRNNEAAMHRKSSVIGFTISSGPVFLDNDLNNQWTRDAKLFTQVTAYYGTPRLLEGFPLSVEAGVDFRRFTMAAHRDKTDCTTYEFADFETNYTYSKMSEQLKLNYIGIPIRICLGQPIKGRTTVYAKVGITPSLQLSSAFEGSGTYCKTVSSTTWGFVIEDLPVIGLVNDEDCYKDAQPTINRFTLWGNLALGACVPLSDTHWQLHAGLKVDYPFLKLGAAVNTPAIQNGTGLLNKGGKELIPSVDLGFVYCFN